MKFILVVLLSFCFLTSKAQSEYDKSYISIGVVVSDLEKSLDFYKNVIGMTETGEFSVDETISKTSGLTGGKPFHVKVLKLIDDSEAAQYKLMSFGNDLKNPDQHIQDQNGMQYITLFIKSTKEVLKRLEDNNIKLLGETPILLPDGKSFILVQDPDGVFIEIIGDE